MVSADSDVHHTDTTSARNGDGLEKEYNGDNGEGQIETNRSAQAGNFADAKPENAATPSSSSATTNSEENAAATTAAADPNVKESKKGQSSEYNRSKARIALIMFALCLAVFLAAIDVTIITTAAPTIAENFQSSAGYTWIGSAYLLASAASTPLWGKISDIWGRKPILLMANFVFFIGSLVAALSINVGMLIVGRAIQGLGGGGLLVLVNICISDMFSMRTRSIYFAMVGVTWAIASSVGPIVGGAFTERVSWRWCFYINLPLDGLAFVILLFVLDVHTPKTPLLDGLKAIDWIGALTIVGGTLMFLFGLEFGGVTYPWASPTVICLLVFGILVLVLFALSQWKLAKYPIMPPRLFQQRTNLAALSVCFIHGINFIAVSYFLPLYFQAVLGASPLMCGVYLLPTTISLSVGSVAGGILIRKTGQYRPFIWGGLLLMTAGTGLFINLGPDYDWPKLIMYQIIAGLGTGPNFQAPLLALQNFVPPRDIATATATFGFTRNIASSISIVVGIAIFQNELQRRSAATFLGGSGSSTSSVNAIGALPPDQQEAARASFAASLSTMWIVYTVIAFVGFAVAFLIRKRTMSAQHEETKTGLDAERERAREDADRRKRRADGEKPTDATAA